VSTSPGQSRMRRGCCVVLVAAGLVPVVSACGSSSPSLQATQVDLKVTLDAGVPAGAPQTWEVACPSPSHLAACERLVATTGAFTPPPPNSACTMIYGGPEVLTVTGNVGARHVDYRTGRANGCEIADYSRDLALVAPFRPVGQTPTEHRAR
jgi:hypothetical protein